MVILADALQSLIGLHVDSKRKEDDPLLVKDLPLSPVHIVRDDMDVYTLLNMFQLGMSRYAKASNLSNITSDLSQNGSRCPCCTQCQVRLVRRLRSSCHVSQLTC